MNLVKEELNRIYSIMGINPIIKEDEQPSKEEIMSRISMELEQNNLMSNKIKGILDKILEQGENKIVDYNLLERGLKKILKLKGNQKKNVESFFQKLLKSLEKREKVTYDIEEPGFDDYSLEPVEPSVVPKKVYKKELFGLQVELLKLQEWLQKTNKTLIIVFEGRDSAGKGSTIKKFVENLNLKIGYKVIALGIPTLEERKNWWDRYRNQIEKGKINLFDRSWYNRGLIEPVAGYGTPEEYKDFMNNVATFENDLVKDGDYLFKLWFSIDKETQAKRFKARQESPLKKWKYSESDAKMQDLWDRFTRYKDKLFDETSTLNNPWVVLDAIDKRVSGLNAIRYVLKNIPYDDKNEAFLDVEYPEALTVLRPEQD